MTPTIEDTNRDGGGKWPGSKSIIKYTTDSPLETNYSTNGVASIRILKYAGSKDSATFDGAQNPTL